MTAEPIKNFTSCMTCEERMSTYAEQTAFAHAVDTKISMWHPEMIILDELGIALALDMVDEQSSSILINNALKAGETVVTGRIIPEWLLQKADYLSRIKAEKHPFQAEKLSAREGVEW